MSDEYDHAVINYNDKPNSFEVGSAGNRFKLYFNTVDDLRAQIGALQEAGFEVNQTPLKWTENLKKE